MTRIFVLLSCINFLIARSSQQKERRVTPDYLIELYHKFTSGSSHLDEEEQDSNKIYTIYPTGVADGTQVYLPQKSTLKFNVSSFGKEENIIGSHLRIYVEQLNSPFFVAGNKESQNNSLPEWKEKAQEVVLTIKTTCTTKINSLTDVLISSVKRWRHTKLLTRAETGKWTKVKVTSAKRILNNLKLYRDLYHIEVWCTISTVKTTKTTGFYASDEFQKMAPIFSHLSTKKPSLVVYVTDNENKTFRKMIEMNRKDHNLVDRELDDVARGHDSGGVRESRHFQRTACALHNFFLNFEKIGWNNRIIYPMELNIRKCSGICPFPMSSTIPHSRHALMQAGWNTRFPHEISPPCCVAMDYRMEILILETEKQFIKSFDDMVVKSCKCL